MNEAEELFLKNIKDENKADRGELLAHLHRVKPKEYGRNSVTTYYKYKYAKQLQPILDHLFNTRESLEFRKEKFPGLKPTTMYHRIASPWTYIIDHMDTEDRKYAILREEVKIRIAPSGIQIIFKDVSELEPLSFDNIKDPERQMEWRDQVNAFLDNASEMKKLYLKKLSLSDEDVEDLQNSLQSLDFIVANITNTQIKIIYRDDLNENQDNDQTREHEEERKLT